MTGFIKKAVLGTALAASTMVAVAPAEAQYYRGRHHDRGGDVAAGALVGGIVGLGLGAAIASSNRDRYYDRGYNYDSYPRGGYYYDNYPRDSYYNDYRYNYRPSCFVERRYDPYWGRRVNVRVCR